MKTLREHLLTLVEKLQINEALELLQANTKENEMLTKLIESYIHGEAGADYYKRLKTYISVAIDKSIAFEENAQGVAPQQAKFLTYYAPNGFFIGREDDMQTLRDRLQAGKRALLLNGLGGIGKTSLARQYAHEYQKEYAHIVWLQQGGDLINAFSQTDLLNSLKISRSQDDTMEVIFTHVLNVLTKLQGVNLLVLDNCEETQGGETAEVLGRVFALPTHWHILLTSRESLLEESKTLYLDVLPEDKAVDLFVEYAKPKSCDRLEVYALLETAGFHTLMTELWAKTYKECFDFEGVAAFAEHLRANSLADGLLQEDIRLQHQHTQIAYGDKEAEKQSTQLNKHLRDTFSVARLSEGEIWLLKQWAVLPATPHKVKDFLLWIGDNARTHKESLKNLLKKGWLHTKDNIAYYLHPALHMVLRQNLKPTYEDCKELCGYLFEALDWKEVRANPVAHEWLIPIGEALFQHIDYTGYMGKQANMLGDLRFLYHELGNYSKALPYAEEVARFYKELGGELSKVYLTSLNNLALVYLDMKDYESALPLYLEIVEKQEKIAGKENENYLSYLHNLSILYYRQGEDIKALPLCQEVVEKRKEILGTQHPDYLASLGNLALLYDDMGEHTKASPLYQEVLEKWKEISDTQHPDYAKTLYNMGLLYHRQGKLEEALPYFEEAYNIQSNTLGEEHPNTKYTKKMLDRTKAGLAKQ